MIHEKLKKRLGFWDSVAINVGIVIGVGIFRVPAEVAKYVDSPFFILICWLIGGAVALLGVLCYAELASFLPETGGTYVYLREAFGRPAGFLFGWAEFAILRAGSIAGVGYILIDYLGNFFPAVLHYEKSFVLAAILIFTLINIVGLHLSTRVQNILSSLKIFSIIVMAGIIFTASSSLQQAAPAAAPSVSHWTAMAPALIPIVWTYGGWHQSTFMSGEFHDTKKDLPLSLIAGIFIVTSVYLLINAAYLKVFTPLQMIESKAIASDAFMRIFGAVGKSIVTVAVLISASGALNSTIMTGGRIPFAVAADYPRLSWFAKVDPHFGTPLRSLLLNSLWAAVLTVWGNFDQLLFFFGFANWLFFALTGLSVFFLSHRKKSHSGYKMIGYPWVPVLFILSSVILCWITIRHAPQESLWGMLLLLAGIPVYFFCRSSATIPDIPVQD